MKKIKIFMLTIALLLIAPLALLFTACDASNLNKEVQVRVGEEYVQWSADGQQWNNVISIDDLKTQLGDTFKGEPGANGTNGTNGTDGKNGRDDSFLSVVFSTDKKYAIITLRTGRSFTVPVNAVAVPA